MKVYLAATTTAMTRSDRGQVIANAKPKYFLETFFSGEKTCAQVLKDAKEPNNFLLDSGAFSYMSGAKCSQKQLEEYCENYIDFIKRHKITQYFELDVDTIFGIQFVEYIRKKMERETGVACIPVWHKGRGIDYWKRMVAEYDYVAIGGLVFHVKQSEWGNIQKMVMYARQKNVKVHGLGFTKTKILPSFPFWSVDSASWSKSAALGQQRNDFNGEYITNHSVADKKHKILLSKLAAHNMEEWTKYQKYMETKKW